MKEKSSRIKIITYDNFPFGGASANLLRYFSLALSAEGNNIQVVLPTGNVYGDKIELDSTKKGTVGNVRYKHLCFINHPHNYFGKLLDLFCGHILSILFFIGKIFRDKFDTIIIYNTHFTRVLNLILFKKLFKKKLIIILPEFYEKPNCKFITLSLIHWYNFYYGLKYLARFADGYIVASNYLKNYIRDVQEVNKPVLVLPNLMDPEIFRVNPSESYLKNKFTIGYAGTPTRKDGVMDLIKSFGAINKKYPKTQLLIIGDVINGDSVIPKLKELAMKLGVKQNITFTGLVPFKEIPTLLNSCQILALTRPSGISAEAGFPTKLGEYFACRKPVLITEVGDIPTYFKNGEHVIIVNPDDINSIVDGFEKIITDEDLSQKLSNNSYKWMDENLNYRNMSFKLSEFINKV